MTENEEYETSSQNFTGNETSNTITPYGQFITSGSDHFLYGNNIRGTAIPEATEDFSDTSYYLINRPPFWDAQFYWPPIGYPSQLDQYTIPAKQRFTDSTFTVCNDSAISGLSMRREIHKLKIWPKPANKTIFFKLDERGVYEIRIYDFNGKIIFHKYLYNNLLTQSINLSFINDDGIYLLSITGSKWHSTAKIIVNK
jgi:hypothetical protein